jgi:signal peptidase II
MSDALARSFRSPVGWACFLLTAIVGFGLDQWSKQAAFRDLCSGIELRDGHPRPVDPQTVHFIPSLIDFTVTTNEGAVFGIGQGQRTLFVVVSAAAILFIGYLYVTSGRQRLYQVLLGMLLAGVLGNLYDRLRFGYVRDMIHALPRWPNLFPYIFNVADSLLCVGVALMIVYSIFHSPSPQAEKQQAPEAA